METYQENNSENFLVTIANFPTAAQQELLQMQYGLRPVAEITVIPKFKDKMLPHIEALKKTGLAVLSKEKSEGTIEYFISKNFDLVKEALVEPVDPVRFGELMGYPRSSIEAYMSKDKDRMLTNEELTEKLGFENWCLNFKVSKAFTQDEEDYFRNSYRIFLEEAPDIIIDSLPTDIDTEEYMRKVAQFVYRTE